MSATVQPARPRPGDTFSVKVLATCSTNNYTVPGITQFSVWSVPNGSVNTSPIGLSHTLDWLLVASGNLPLQHANIPANVWQSYEFKFVLSPQASQSVYAIYFSLSNEGDDITGNLPLYIVVTTQLA